MYTLKCLFTFINNVHAARQRRKRGLANDDRWDDWVPQDRIRKNTEENKELASNLKFDQNRVLKGIPYAAATSSKKKAAAGSDLSSARGSEDRQTPALGRGQKRNRDFEIEKVSENLSSTEEPSAPAPKRRATSAPPSIPASRSKPAVKPTPAPSGVEPQSEQEQTPVPALVFDPTLSTPEYIRQRGQRWDLPQPQGRRGPSKDSPAVPPATQVGRRRVHWDLPPPITTRASSKRSLPALPASTPSQVSGPVPQQPPRTTKQTPKQGVNSTTLSEKALGKRPVSSFLEEDTPGTAPAKRQCKVKKTISGRVYRPEGLVTAGVGLEDTPRDMLRSVQKKREIWKMKEASSRFGPPINPCPSRTWRSHSV